ncbi:hypothetical protein AA23498_2439 [Acetobacter nitrogenifigens DSM 23921 = NBRC 105050]|nr:hypothetical protein AA23498_2439 [Acetobacter nitrogenifigens DSM 23921 = NBRC 105050]
MCVGEEAMSDEATMTDLKTRLAAWDVEPIMATMDGGFFDDLPALLASAGFRFRSLFIEQTEAEAKRHSPVLVAIPKTRVDEFLALPEAATGSVFWNASGCEEMAFFRHLRGLTMVRIPVDEKIDYGRTHMCVFRHFDPATVAITLPAMRDAQRARMFGPAISILVNAPEGVLEARRRENWPIAERGVLVFEPSQMAMIALALNDRSQRKIIQWLRGKEPDLTSKYDDVALHALVTDIVRYARLWNISSEEGLAWFTWLWVTTDGEVHEDENVKEFIYDFGNDGADIRLLDLIEEINTQDSLSDFA